MSQDFPHEHQDPAISAVFQDLSIVPELLFVRFTRRLSATESLIKLHSIL